MGGAELNRKVCVVGPSKRFFSGLTAHTIFLANALSEQDDTSVVLLRKLLPEFLYPGKGHIGKDNYLINFKEGMDVYDGMDWYSPASWIGACRFLGKHRPDVIIMPWWTSAVAHMQIFLAAANRLTTKARLVLEMHEVADSLEESILPLRLYSRMAGRLLTRGADAFVVHSRSAKAQVVETYSIPEDKVLITPIGLYQEYCGDHDAGAAKAELGAGQEFVILYFGSLRKYKGVRCLVEAFGQLPESIRNTSRLVIAGEDWGEEDFVQNSIESLPYKDRITLKPEFVPDEMIPGLFSAADAVVLPYLRTSGSGVAQIAMAYGKAIVTSELQTMRECLNDYSGAWFAQPGDPPGIRDCLLEVRARWESGHSLTFEPPQNTWKEIAQQYQELIGRVCHGF
jgi:glycosyltransferase involved in cell wall biosynthesis